MLRLGIKAIGMGTIDIKHTPDFATKDQRDDKFGAGSGIACDMSGKGLYVRYVHGLSFPHRCGTYTAVRVEDSTCGPAVKGAETEARSIGEIEPNPVHVTQRPEEQRRHVGHQGQRWFALSQQGFDLCEQQFRTRIF